MIGFFPHKNVRACCVCIKLASFLLFITLERISIYMHIDVNTFMYNQLWCALLPLSLIIKGNTIRTFLVKLMDCNLGSKTKIVVTGVDQ